MKTPLPAVPAGLALGSLLLVSCAGGPEVVDFRPARPEITAEPVLVQQSSSAPEQVEANWKECLPQAYVFVEHQGDYRDLGVAMRRVLQVAEDWGWKISGPPFALFYDDPGRVAVDGLRSRACLPVQKKIELRPGDVGFEVLPRSMVVYARVSGAYPKLPRVYPALFGYLQRLGWVAGGPIREVYLTDPQDVETYDELQAEVQIPWSR